MDRDLLLAMLESRPDLDREDATFRPSEGVTFDLLLRSESGSPVPLTKVTEILLGDRFLTVTAADSSWVLGYAAITGVKTTRRGETSARRTGFQP